ncbi:MAG: FAD-dependent oxidoreductase [Clostridia bacterium]
MGQKIVIVGGVAGGATAAARLRRLDEQAEIVLFERGEYISFANCGLPYYIGGEIRDREALTLQTPQSFYARFHVQVRIHSEVVAIHAEQKSVTVREVLTGKTYEEAYDSLVLSMGAEPIRPPMEGIDTQGVFTLRSIPDTLRIKAFVEEHQVQHAVVVGGGFIGVEMAENLCMAGIKVTLVEMAPQVLAPIDEDLACDVHQHMAEKGVALCLNRGVQRIEKHGAGLRVQLSQGEVCADMVILAIGVKPESGLAKAAGIACSDRGAILTDAHMRTSDEHIYAVGDAVAVVDFVTGKAAYVPLAGPANKQGRIAADNLCGISSTYPGTQGSSILKVFDLTVASTGVNEKQAKRLAIDYDKVFLYIGSHAGYYPGATSMSMKVLFEKNSGKILGAQIVGRDGVDKRCDVLATAIHAGMTAADLTKLELCYAPPYSSAKDPVNMAGFVIENVLGGLVKQFHWHDVDALPRDGSVQLLDVRTVSEVRRGKIEGFQNIPLDELRERIAELTPQKPIYVHCHSGLRSYLACRILSGHGFDCYNLSGGYRLYSAVRNQQRVPEYRCTDCR